MLAESSHVPAGRVRVHWLAGGVLAAIKEGVVVIRIGALAAVLAAALLVVYTLVRYPAAAGGGGGPLYLTLVVLLLVAYAAITVWLTTRTVLASGLRYGTAFGLAGAVLPAIAAMPFGGFLSGQDQGPRALMLLTLSVLVIGIVAAAAVRTARETPATVEALAAGVWTGMLIGLVVFLLGMGMATASPGRLALDPSVVARHTGSELIAANLGETAVLYILGLVVGPVMGALGGALGIAFAETRTTWQERGKARRG